MKTWIDLDALIVIFDKRGVVHKETLPPGVTVNAVFYKEILALLHKAVKRKQPETTNLWILQYDNAPAHAEFVVTAYLTRTGVSTLPQPPYSLDFSPTAFFLFPKLRRSHVPVIQKAVTEVF